MTSSLLIGVDASHIGIDRLIHFLVHMLRHQIEPTASV
jgi:hypothetical protein